MYEIFVIILLVIIFNHLWHLKHRYIGRSTKNIYYSFLILLFWFIGKL